MINTTLAQQLTASVRNIFPNTTAIIIWGSSIYADTFQDIDLLIVTENLPSGDIAKNYLFKLIQQWENKLEIDAAVTTHEKLQKFEAVNIISGIRDLHGFDRYQIKYLSQVIWGDEQVLTLLPDITVQEALKNVLPYIKGEMVPLLQGKLKAIDDSDINGFLQENMNSLLVLVRTIYSIQTLKITTKAQAIHYIQNENKNTENLLYALLDIYRTGSTQRKVTKIEVVNLIKLLEKTVDSECL